MVVSKGLVPRLSWTVDGSSHPCAFQNRRSIRLSRRSGSRSPPGSGNAGFQILADPRRRTWPTFIHFLSTPNPITMGTRASGSASTALRRLMTEYKQLTASGQSGLSRLSLFAFSLTHSFHRLARRHVHSWCGTLLPLAYHQHHTVRLRLLPSLRLGPISESDFFTWEALICGPKDTPFVKFNSPFFPVFC